MSDIVYAPVTAIGKGIIGDAWLPIDSTHADYEYWKSRQYASTQKHLPGQHDQDTHGNRTGVQAVTQTPEFKAWFGNSKIVNEDGSPKVVYHGTGADFTEFDWNKLGENSMHPSSQFGFYFAEDPNLANDFAGEKKGSNVLPVYLKMENPMYMPAKDFAEDLDFYKGIRGGYGRSNDEYWESVGHYDDLRNWLQEQGYDGLVIQGSEDNGGYPELAHDNYVVFESNQVKSATGNTGAFDPENYDITKEIVEKVDETASVIIAFDLSDSKYVADIQKQIPATVHEDQHMTLLYLGNADYLNGVGITKQSLEKALEEFARQQAPIRGTFTGVATFDKDDAGYPIVLLYDSPQLAYLRVRLHEWLKQYFHIQLIQDHGFIPHVTLAYVNEAYKLHYAEHEKHDFHSIALFYGHEHSAFELSGRLVEKQLPIDDAGKARLIDVRLNVFYNDTDRLSERMYTGEISIGQWEEQMRKLIREVHSSVTAIGKGGWEQVSSAEWGYVGPEAKKQYRYLHGFAEWIADNRETASLNAIQARARMYGNASRHTAYMVQAGKALMKALPWLPGDGSTECLVNCKCRWELTVTKRTKTKQAVRAVWKLGVAEHCDDCTDRNNYVHTMMVDSDVAIPATIGGY